MIGRNVNVIKQTHIEQFPTKLTMLSFAYCYHLLIIIIWLLLSFGYCYHLVIGIIWLLLPFAYYYYLVIAIIWLLFSFGYCYHLVIVIIWLLLSFGYCYHWVMVIIWLLLSLGYCYHLVIVIIWLLLLFGYCFYLVNVPKFYHIVACTVVVEDIVYFILKSWFWSLSNFSNLRDNVFLGGKWIFWEFSKKLIILVDKIVDTTIQLYYINAEKKQQCNQFSENVFFFCKFYKFKES